jgi:hypothetical protein
VFISAHGQVREQRHDFARTVFKSFFTNTYRWCAEELNPHVDYPKKREITPELRSYHAGKHESLTVKMHHAFTEIVDVPAQRLGRI